MSAFETVNQFISLRFCFSENLNDHLGGMRNLFTGGFTIYTEHIHVRFDCGVHKYPRHLTPRIFFQASSDLSLLPLPLASSERLHPHRTAKHCELIGGRFNAVSGVHNMLQRRFYHRVCAATHTLTPVSHRSETCPQASGLFMRRGHWEP